MARGRYTNVNFSKLPEPLNDDYKKQLVDQLQRTGDCKIVHEGRTMTIRNLMIESHICLVRSIAGQFDYPDLQELVSEGLLILTQIIDDFECCKCINDNIGGYIQVVVRKELLKFIRSAALVPVKPDAYANGVRFGKRVSKLLNNVAVAPSTTIEVDVRDALAQVTKTKHQRIIGDCMLAGGYKLKDMAELCDGIHVSRVSQIKQKISADFLEVWGR